MEDRIIDLIENTWGEGEEVALALIYFFDGNEEIINEVIEKELIFNRYIWDISSWIDLGWALINDDCLDLENAEPEYFNELKSYLDDNDENAVRDMLLQNNWAIDQENDVAIGFDSNIEVIHHER